MLRNVGIAVRVTFVLEIAQVTGSSAYKRLYIGPDCPIRPPFYVVYYKILLSSGHTLLNFDVAYEIFTRSCSTCCTKDKKCKIGRKIEIIFSYTRLT